jgi:uncharacterized protein (TIGR03382 family)
MNFFRGKLFQIAGFALVSFGLPGYAAAASISNTGTFTTDDQIFQVEFTLSAISTVTFQSFGYGGGTNGAGTVIPQGGFATNVAVFSASGSQSLIDQDSLGGNPPSDCSPRNINSVTGFCFDGFLSLNLSAGSYILTVTEQGNPANGNTLADGFPETGAGNFTGGPFIDPEGNQMNGNWAVDISGRDLVVNSTPEPATVLLSLVLVPGLAVAVRRRRHVSSSL